MKFDWGIVGMVILGLACALVLELSLKGDVDMFVDMWKRAS